MERRRGNEARRWLPRLVLLAALGAFQPAGGADWPRWRGPNGDGISVEKNWFTTGAVARTVWEASVGAGYSSVAIRGGKLYTMGYADNRDTVVCLDEKTGKPIWQHSYACPPGSTYPGPRATPTLDGDRLYTYSREGHLLCLDARTGTLKWRRDLGAEPGVKPPGWGLASSPLIIGGMVLVNAGHHGFAADKMTGTSRWQSGRDGASYASVVPWSAGGRPGVLVFQARGLAAVDLSTGSNLWEFPWTTQYDINAADPIVMSNKVFITDGYGHGSVLLDTAVTPPKVIWQNNHIASQFSSVVLWHGHLYGITGNAGGGQLRCLDAATGELRWSERQSGYGSLMVADDKLIILTERGVLTVAQADPEAYRELWREKILDGTCWTPPVLCNGRIFCRNDRGTLICLELK